MSLEYKVEDSRENKINDLRNEIDSDLSDLKNEISEIRNVEKLQSGSIRVPYDWKGEKREFILTRNGENINVRVKKKTFIKELGKKDWVTQGNTKEKQISFQCKNSEEFKREFGKILDKYVGKDRKPIPDKAHFAYDLLFPKPKELGIKKTLKHKPIDLSYKAINPEKKIEINLPSINSIEGRILRCLRWKVITDVVEKKYGIPDGLLLAMMAREGLGDPTQPNELGNGKSDGGLGAIHMQPRTAQEFGLETLPTYTDGFVDIRNGNEILNAKSKYSNNLKQLVELDDRFHPIMSIDAAARYLKYQYERIDYSKDRRLNALKKYSGRSVLDEYVWPVINYRILINQYTGKALPSFGPNTNKEIQKIKKSGKINVSKDTVPLNIVKNTANMLVVKLNGKPSSYDGYLGYFKLQAENYGLKEYINNK